MLEMLAKRPDQSGGSELMPVYLVERGSTGPANG
jgi:hypothetical protein